MIYTTPTRRRLVQCPDTCPLAASTGYMLTGLWYKSIRTNHRNSWWYDLYKKKGLCDRFVCTHFGVRSDEKWQVTNIYCFEIWFAVMMFNQSVSHLRNGLYFILFCWSEWSKMNLYTSSPQFYLMKSYFRFSKMFILMMM